MLNQLLLQGFNLYLDPLVERGCGDSKIKEFGFKALITASSALVSYGLFSVNEFGAKIFHSFSSIVLGSIITDNIGKFLATSEEWIADKLEEYDGYDQYADLIAPALHISAGICLRQVAGLSTNIPGFTSWMESKDTSIGSLEIQTNRVSITDDSPKGCLAKICSRIGSAFGSVIKLGQSIQYTEGHLVSNSLDIAGGNFLLNGVIKFVTNITGAVLGRFTSSNELSVYDIKNILKAQIPAAEYNRAEVKAQAEQIFAKFQQSEQYYLKQKPEIQEKIDIVTGLYNKNLGLAIKVQYGSALSSNPKQLEKLEVLSEKLMTNQIIERLLNARKCYGEIKQLEESGITISADNQNKCREFSKLKLGTEIKTFGNVTSNEEATHLDLFSRATELELMHKLAIGDLAARNISHITCDPQQTALAKYLATQELNNATKGFSPQEAAEYKNLFSACFENELLFSMFMQNQSEAAYELA